jgi:hypothetical protein
MPYVHDEASRLRSSIADSIAVRCRPGFRKIIPSARAETVRVSHLLLVSQILHLVDALDTYPPLAMSA